MTYLVRIGKQTRSGGFQELLLIPVESKAPLQEVKNYFLRKYDGLEVAVSYFKAVEIDTVGEENSYLADILVEYTADEREMADKYFEKYDEGYAVLEKLKEKIKERYKALPFTAIDDSERRRFSLTIGRDNAVIDQLPIYGTAFIQHVGKDGKI